jgi:hypothetical protein
MVKIDLMAITLTAIDVQFMEKDIGALPDLSSGNKKIEFGLKNSHIGLFLNDHPGTLISQ